MLSSQNTQLWKLIEKQRAVHGNAIKELERVRADRDKALAKLDPERASRKPYAHRSSSSGTTNPTPGRRLTESPSPAPERSSGHRFPMIRHQSDDGAFTHTWFRCSTSDTHHFPVSLSSPRSSATIPSLSTSRSHEPLGPRDGVHISGSSTIESLANGTLSQAEVNESPPPRSDSLLLGDSPAGASSSASTQPLHVHKLHVPAATVAAPVSASTDPVPTSSTASIPASPTHSISGPAVPIPKPQPSLPHSSPQGPLVALAVPSEHNRTVGRESRISLPDEARRYIANMSESPMPSPRQAAFTNGKINGQIAEQPVPSVAEDHGRSLESRGLEINGPHGVSTSPARFPVESSSPGTAQQLDVQGDSADKSSAFLDLEDDDEEPSSMLTQSGEPTTAVPHVSPSEATFSTHGSTSLNQQQYRPLPSTDVGTTPALALPSTSHQPHPTLAPHTFEASTSRDPLLSSGLDVDVRGSNTTISPISTGTSRSTPPPSHSQDPGFPVMRLQGPSPTQAQVQAQRAAYAQAQEKHSAHVRSLSNPPQPGPGAIYGNPNGRARLLESDLGRCKVRVVGSNIRANDRGKEVLSFVVQVSPSGSPDAADSWKLEKLYSDVLGLDARIRAKLTRSNLKKLGNLPDNKLFKDHAPAKVDQRKAG